MSIELLIERYFKGLTSIEEEHQIREYFKGEVAPHLRHLKSYFNLFEKSSELKSTTIRTEADVAAIIHKRDTTSGTLRPLRKWVSIAAVLFLLITAGSLIYFFTLRTNQTKYSREEIQLALSQATQILGYISSRLNQAIDPLNHLDKLDYVLQTLQPISELEENISHLPLSNVANDSPNQ